MFFSFETEFHIQDSLSDVSILQVLLELSFPEISKVVASNSGRLFDQTVTFTTLLLEDFTFKCSNAEDIRDVVDFFLKGLKDRSQYAVATGSYKPLRGGEGLRRGDLVRICLLYTSPSPPDHRGSGKPA